MMMWLTGEAQVSRLLRGPGSLSKKNSQEQKPLNQRQAAPQVFRRRASCLSFTHTQGSFIDRFLSPPGPCFLDSKTAVSVHPFRLSDSVNNFHLELRVLGRLRMPNFPSWEAARNNCSPLTDLILAMLLYMRLVSRQRLGSPS